MTSYFFPSIYLNIQKFNFKTLSSAPFEKSGVMRVA